MIIFLGLQIFWVSDLRGFHSSQPAKRTVQCASAPHACRQKKRELYTVRVHNDEIRGTKLCRFEIVACTIVCWSSIGKREETGTRSEAKRSEYKYCGLVYSRWNFNYSE